ncbi:hypothetical protein SRHO_G00203500 [Serrasalmus rhombeus]
MHRSLAFLGHVLSEKGIQMSPDKIQAIQDYPEPDNIKDVQRFHGMAGWDIKEALQSAPILQAPDFSKPFVVQTDASENGVGAVLTQKVQNQEQVIAYASRLLNPAEQAYSVSEKECLAVVRAVEKWRQYLEGHKFTVVMDHAALTWVFNQPRPSSRLMRWAIKLQSLHFKVVYHKGQSNVVPDLLSRSLPPAAPLTICQPSLSLTQLPVSWEEIGTSQLADAEIQKLIQEIRQDQEEPN